MRLGLYCKKLLNNILQSDRKVVRKQDITNNVRTYQCSKNKALHFAKIFQKMFYFFLPQFTFLLYNNIEQSPV